MNETPDPPNENPADQSQLARSGAQQPAGSMMRLRDVQALNRSFRRLADVNEALLDQLAEMQAERQSPSRWIVPVVGVGSMVLGVGLAIFGLGWYQQQQEPPQIEVQSAQPEIVLEPTPVTVQIPAETISKATLDEFMSELEEERKARAEDRRVISDLRNQLVEQEEAALGALQNLGALAEGMSSQTGASLAPAQPAPQQPAATVDDGIPDELQPANPWLGTLNGLLAMDGHPGLQFRSATRVLGEKRMTDVTALEWDASGALRGVLKADIVDFDLHHMTATLVVVFRNGHRTQGGQRWPFGAEGSRFEFQGVSPDNWTGHFPELGVLSEQVGAGGYTTSEVMQVRTRLDEFLAERRSYGYYRLGSLGGIEDGRLNLVQIQWFDGAGRLIKTIEADSLEVKLHPPDSVELLLRQGAVLEGGQRKPFYEDRYRIFLPKQTLEQWRGSGIPLTDRT